MDGVKMISDIINHILSMNQGRSRKFSHTLSEDSPIQQEVVVSQQDEDDQIPVQQKSPGQSSQTTSDMMIVPDEKETTENVSPLQKCQIDRIDAKTLNLCVQSITTLINEDTTAFMEFPLNQRIRIFKQMSQLLDLSFSLYPLLEQRQLKSFTMAANQENQEEEKSSTANSGATIIDQQVASARRSQTMLLYGNHGDHRNGAKSERRQTVMIETRDRINQNTGSVIMSGDEDADDNLI